MIEACVYIAARMNYTIENILEHSVEWFFAMIEYLSKADFEENISQLIMHGADNDAINKMRSEYDRQFGKVKKKVAPQHATMTQFKISGLSIGRPNKTRVVR